MQQDQGHETAEQMITYIRTVEAIPGKFGDAIKICQEIVARVNEVSGSNLVVAVNFGADPHTIAFIGQVESAAKLEEDFPKMSADPAYQTATKGVLGVLVPGSIHERIWRHI